MRSPFASIRMKPGSYTIRITKSLIIVLIGFLLQGCASRGPQAVRSDWRDYNDSIVDIANKELLLNIVRLRYNDYPGVLRIGSLTSQRSWNMNGSLGGDLTDGGPDSLSAGIGGFRSERPTISFLPGSKDTVSGTVTPLSLEALYLASYLEWPASTYWPLMVKSLNGVQNAPEGGGPIPTKPPQFGEFFKLTHGLGELQRQDLVEIGRIEKLVPLNRRIKAATLTAAESRDAAESGYIYEDSDRPDELVLSRKKQVSVLRFSPKAIGTPQHTMIVDMLNLDPTLLAFELEHAFEGTLTESGQKNKSLEVGLRSLMEMLFLVSKGVQVPPCDLANNTAPSNDIAIDWQPMIGKFRVLSCEEEPTCAAVAVCYRGSWFYVADNDQDSKTSFFFIKLIYDAQIQGGGAENLPVLTLPL